jgi:transposase-like protein
VKREKMTEEDKQDDSGPRKRLSDEEFASVKELYELGKAGVADLAESFGVSRQTLSRRFKDAGIEKGSRAHEIAQAQGAAVKAVSERFAESRAQWIEETRVEALKTLKQTRLIGQKIVIDQVKTKGPLGAVDDDLRALGRFNKLLIENVTTALNILRADEHVDDEDLPTLTIEDLSNDDILKHHIDTGALPEDATFEDLNLEPI